jgi:N-acetylglucosamine-6-phosphate deacetylase
MAIVRGYILQESGRFARGSIDLGVVDDGKIGSLHCEDAPEDEARIREQSKLPIVLPGFIDLHVHGGGGHDIMEGGEAALRVAEAHVRHGTTSLLATTMTAPTEDLEKAFQALTPFIDSNQPAGAMKKAAARIAGVHLEGPYIHPEKLGAQPAFARALSSDELKKLDALAKIRVITIAPEVSAHMEAIAALVAKEYVVQIGHSGATYEEGRQALEQGARGFTHLFNAMSPLHHRAPGLVGAALAHAEYAELIVDLLHLHPGAIRAALRSIPRAYCVTDATAATTMPDGDYKLGRQTVTKCGGGVRLADGTLAGSTLTMDQAFRNLVTEIGVSLSEAAQRVSTNAADYLRLGDRGRLAKGMWADAVVMDPRELKIVDVIVKGRSLA